MVEILLYGIIGDPIDHLDAKTVTTAIRAATGPLSVRINSPGGYVMEGLAIVQALRDYPAKIMIYIDGLAASMASVIAMVGTEIIMAESALIMVHKPWDSSIGNADDLRRDAAKLDKIEAQLIGIYAKRTGLPEGELAGMLADETWLDPEQALSMGFITSIAAPLQIAACAVRSTYGFRNTPEPLREHYMPTPTPTPSPSDPVAIERGRITGILGMAKHGIPDAALNAMIQNGTSIEAAREAVLDHLAAQGDALNIGHAFGGGGRHQTLDNPETYGEAVRDALVAKISGTAAEGPAAEFRGMTVVDIARDFLARQGNRDVLRMPADRVINAVMSPSARQRDWGMGGARGLGGMHTTSDFPDLVGGAAEKFLIARYVMQQSQLKLLASVSSRSNFLMHYGVQLGSMGPLDQVSEAGEFKNRTIATRKEGYKIETYGAIFAVSRQMLINDGLQALAEVLTVMAAGATETEASLLAAFINTNAPLQSDSVPWFHATHKNLAPAGAPPTVASLDEGRQAMRSQTDVSGGGVIDAKPKYLVTGAKLETAAEVLTGTLINPTTTADVNPFAGKLTPIADPRITSSTAWWLFADPNFSPALQISYLDGVTQPFLDTQEGWRTDGTEYKVRHDFGAGILDHRMAWKNPGA